MTDPIHISTVIDTVTKNISDAIRRKEAKERKDRERAERKLAQDEHNKRKLRHGEHNQLLLKDVLGLVRQEPPRLVARHATELPFPAVMYRRDVGPAHMVYISITGTTWRATTRYDEVVKKVSEAPEAGRITMFKGMTAPLAHPPLIVVPTGVFPPVKIPTPVLPS